MGGDDIIIRFLAIDLVSGVADRAGYAIERMAGRMGSGMAATGRAWMSTGSAIAQTGLMVAAAAAGFALGAYEAVRAANDYNSQLVLLITHANMLPSLLGKVHDDLLKLGPELGWSPTQLAHAFYEVQSAATSLPPALQNLASLEDILAQAAKLAQIGHADLDATTRALVSVLAAYANQNLSASTAAAILNRTVGEGRMRMSDLAAAFAGGLLPVAAQAGVSIQSLGAALATLTDEGVPATRAATYLRSAIIQMTVPSGPAAKALKAIGLGADEAATRVDATARILEAAGVTVTQVARKLQESGNLADVMQMLHDRMVSLGMSAPQAAALLAKAFGGIRSGTGVVGLYDNLTGLQQKMKDNQDAVAHWGDTWAEFQRLDPTFIVKKIEAAFDSLKIHLGEALGPAFRFFAVTLFTVIGAVDSFIQHNSRLIGVLVPLLILALSAAGLFLTLGGAMIFATGAGMAWIGLFMRVGGTLGVLAGAGGLVGKTLALAGAPIRGFIGLLEGAGGIIATAARYLGAFGLEALRLVPGFSLIGRAVVGAVGVFRALPAVLARIAPILLGVLPTFGRFLSFLAIGGDFALSFGGIIRLLVGSLLRLGLGGPVAILGGIVGALKMIAALDFGALFRAGLGGLAGLGRTLGVLLMTGLRSGLMMLGPALWSGIVAGLTTLGPILLVVAAIAAVLAIAAVAIHDHWGQVVGVFNRVTRAVGAAVGVFMATRNAGKAFETLLRGLGIGGGAASAAMRIFHQVLGLVKTAIQSAVDMARRFLNGLAENLHHIHGMNQALGYLKVAFFVLLAVLYVIGSFLAGLLGGVFQALLTFLSVAIPTAIQVAIDIINLLGQIFKTMGDLIGGVVQIVTDLIHGNWKKAWDDAGKLVSKLKDDVGGILKQLVTTVKDIFTGLWNAILLTTLGFVEGFIGALANIPGPVGEQFKKAKSAMQGVLDTMKGAAINDGAEVGTNLANGIAAGISTHSFGIENAAMAAVHAAKDAADKAIDASSPARLLRDTTGRWFAQGIAVGIADTTPAITRAAVGAVTAPHQAASNAVRLQGPTSSPSAVQSSGDDYGRLTYMALLDILDAIRNGGSANSKNSSNLESLLYSMQERADQNRRLGLRGVTV